MKSKLHSTFFTLAALAFCTLRTTVEAQSTAFTYQGKLDVSGVPASGFYDFQFSLYNSPEGPPAGIQVGNTLTNIAVGVTNGEFTASLDFGAVFTGNAIWLAMSVRSNGLGTFTAMTPLQELTPTPYAIYAETAGVISGTLPVAQLPAAVVTNSEPEVTLGYLTVNGNLDLAAEVTIYSGTNTLMHNDENLNFFTGQSAGDWATTGNGNTAYGALALNQNGVGSGNTAVGAQALQFSTNDNQLVAVGYQALQNDNAINEGEWLTVSGNGENTAIGYQALTADTQGFANTAIGYQSLNQNTIGEASTAIGDGTLFCNTSGLCNTAIGYQTLFSNTIGSQNTGNGLQALYANTTGSGNTATGWGAMCFSVKCNNNVAEGYDALELTTNDSELVAVGYGALENDNATNFQLGGTRSGNGENTAVGFQALLSDFTGFGNTAMGFQSLNQNTNGNFSTAIGDGALYASTSGNFNTASGCQALFINLTGNENTANGYQALYYSGGSKNIALGYQAGFNITSGSNNIDIGNEGGADDNNAIKIGEEGTQTNAFIAGIYDNVSFTGPAAPVYVDATGHLGIAGSSERFKQNVRSMDDASDALLSLRPVTYKYKPGLDPKGSAQFGLIAEEVDKVDPDLVVHDARRGIYTVRYDAINVMLLNEFLKQHKKIDDQNAEIESLKEKSAKVDELEKQLNDLKQTVQSLIRRN